uniref:Uncharacterized protein n=1 Tax=viral metagenome TaxID=1070528 RepID=A0A6C0BDQ2_9ZZZZ
MTYWSFSKGIIFLVLCTILFIGPVEYYSRMRDIIKNDTWYTITYVAIFLLSSFLFGCLIYFYSRD